MPFLFTKTEKQFRLANDNTYCKEIKIHDKFAAKMTELLLKRFIQVVEHYLKAYIFK